MIKSLTSLRGIFILFIFFHHCMDLYPSGGSMAVTFFFILGGFSMSLGYKDKVVKDDFSYKRFITKRIIKFYPLHWLCLIAILPLGYLYSSSWMTLPTFTLNALLLQSWVPVEDVYFSFNSVSWYLADTMFFAIVFPFIFKWIYKATFWGRVSIALVLAFLYTTIVLLIPVERYHSILYISPYMRLIDFIFGIYLALLYFRLKKQPSLWWTDNIKGSLFIFLCIVLLVVESCVLNEKTILVAVVYWPLVAILILNSCLSSGNDRGNLFENKVLVLLGECSFTIYMIHKLILRYSDILFIKLLRVENSVIYIIFCLIMTIIISIVVDRYILKPITQWLTKRNQQSMTARS